MTDREAELLEKVRDQAARIAELEAKLEEAVDDCRDRHAHAMQDWCTRCGSCGTCNVCCNCDYRPTKATAKAAGYYNA